MDGARVLVVEDNEANTVLFTALLQARGYVVRCIDDGRELEAAVATFQPQLILMDVQLPGVDGLELARRLKADPATARIPVLAVTAYAMMGDRDRVLAAGCDAYMSKPIDTRALPHVLAELLRAAQSNDGA